jgi:hypothetical protein
MQQALPRGLGQALPAAGLRPHRHGAVCRHDLVLGVGVPEAEAGEVVQQVLVHHYKLACRGSEKGGKRNS